MSDLYERLSVETPDNISLDAEIAGFGTRCVAAMVDYLILGILLILLLFGIGGTLSSLSPSVSLAVIVIIQFVLITFYHLLFELLWNGQTFGKRWAGIRVMRANGMPLTPTATIIRNLVRLFDYLPALYGVGLMVMLLSRKTQRLGDIAAGTIVLRERSQLTMTKLKNEVHLEYAFTTPTEEIPAIITLAALSPADRQMVLNFLLRRDTILNQETLALQLARKFAAQMNIDYITIRSITSSSMNATRFLEFILRAEEQEHASQ